MLTLMPCAKLVSSSCFWLQTMQGPSVILYSVSWSNIPSGICNWLHTFLCFEFRILGETMQHPVSQLSCEWKQTLKDKNLCNASRKAASFWISWNGWLCERARGIKSWALIGYTSGQDGAVMPAQDCPPCSCKKNVFWSRITKVSFSSFHKIRFETRKRYSDGDGWMLAFVF